MDLGNIPRVWLPLAGGSVALGAIYQSPHVPHGTLRVIGLAIAIVGLFGVILVGQVVFGWCQSHGACDSRNLLPHSQSHLRLGNALILRSLPHARVSSDAVDFCRPRPVAGHSRSPGSRCIGRKVRRRIPRISQTHMVLASALAVDPPHSLLLFLQ